MRRQEFIDHMVGAHGFGRFSMERMTIAQMKWQHEWRHSVPPGTVLVDHFGNEYGAVDHEHGTRAV